MLKSTTEKLQTAGFCALIATAAHAVTIPITPGPLLNPGSNLVQNGSFEKGFSGNPQLQPSYWATGTALTPFQTINNWTTSGGPSNYAYRADTGFASASAPVPDGQLALYFGNGFAASISETPTFNPDGSVSFVSPSPTITSLLGQPVNIQQTVGGLSTGNKYALSFWASGEDSNSNNNGHDGIFGFDLTGYSTTYLAAPSNAPGGIGSQNVYRFEFVPISNSITIGFTNWGHFSGAPSVPGAETPGWTIPLNTTELVLDHVILNDLGPVDMPEPATMGLIGIAGYAMLSRNRKRSCAGKSSED